MSLVVIFSARFYSGGAFWYLYLYLFDAICGGRGTAAQSHGRASVLNHYHIDCAVATVCVRVGGRVVMPLAWFACICVSVVFRRRYV